MSDWFVWGMKKTLTVKWRHILWQHGLKNNLADDIQNLKVIVLKSVKLLLPMHKVSEKRKYVGEKLQKSHFEICYKRERALNIHILQNLSKIVNLEWKTMVVHIRTMCKILVQTICSFFWIFYPQSGFKVHVNNVQWSWTKLNNGQGHTRPLWKNRNFSKFCPYFAKRSFLNLFLYILSTFVKVDLWNCKTASLMFSFQSCFIFLILLQSIAQSNLN